MRELSLSLKQSCLWQKLLIIMQLVPQGCEFHKPRDAAYDCDLKTASWLQDLFVCSPVGSTFHDHDVAGMRICLEKAAANDHLAVGISNAVQYPLPGLPLHAF